MSDKVIYYQFMRLLCQMKINEMEKNKLKIEETFVLLHQFIEKLAIEQNIMPYCPDFDKIRSLPRIFSILRGLLFRFCELNYQSDYEYYLALCFVDVIDVDLGDTSFGSDKKQLKHLKTLANISYALYKCLMYETNEIKPAGNGFVEKKEINDFLCKIHYELNVEKNYEFIHNFKEMHENLILLMGFKIGQIKKDVQNTYYTI
jgi:hypothetical protein